MIAYTNNHKSKDSREAVVYQDTLRLSLVKTVIPYSKIKCVYRLHTVYRVTMYHAKRRFIHNVCLDRSPFVINLL